jgi:hypothetical protein
VKHKEPRRRLGGRRGRRKPHVEDADCEISCRGLTYLWASEECTVGEEDSINGDGFRVKPLGTGASSPAKGRE